MVQITFVEKAHKRFKEIIKNQLTTCLNESKEKKQKKRTIKSHNHSVRNS